MRMIARPVIPFLCGLTIVTACGGSGSGDGANFAGLYQVHLVTIENNCSFAVPPDDREYRVNQDGSRIVVDRVAEGGRIYEGTVTGERSFVVSSVGREDCVFEDGSPAPGSTYQFTRTIEAETVGDNEARLTFTSDHGNCTDNGLFDSTCRYKMVGAAAITRP